MGRLKRQWTSNILDEECVRAVTRSNKYSVSTLINVGDEQLFNVERFQVCNDMYFECLASGPEHPDANSHGKCQEDAADKSPTSISNLDLVRNDVGELRSMCVFIGLDGECNKFSRVKRLHDFLNECAEVEPATRASMWSRNSQGLNEVAVKHARRGIANPFLLAWQSRCC